MAASLSINTIERKRVLSPVAYLSVCLPICLSVGLSAGWSVGKWPIGSAMPFGVVSGVSRRMEIVEGNGQTGSLGVNVGHPILTKEDVVA